ncbi:MAG: C_GCAxxG_C_C family protein [Proteobacteria bacterium]|nr:C_GCAxxG_C_C family protein [Pseudomonadota bacterium]
MTKEKFEISSFGTARTFIKRGTCSETLMAVLNNAYGHPMEAEEQAAIPLAGGIAQQGYQCGMLWGASLAAGAQAYRLFGAGPQAEAAAIFAAQRLVESLGARENSINCLEITETDWNNKWQVTKYFIKGGPVSCLRRVMGFAKEAFDVINTALAEAPVEASNVSVSCAAELARKMGVSEMHAVMAAGLAGGIGFSGGACGALGTAIWLKALNSDKPTGLSLMTPEVSETIDQFLKSTDHEFECSEIVGRKFENIDDHAGHMCGGGCSKILEGLAATGKKDAEKECHETAA